jgi:Acyl-protein synthetase, LuxE
MVHAYETNTPMPESFDALAVDLARFQAEHVEGYRRLVAARGVDVSTIARAGQAPAVPTDAFKVARVSAFPEAETPVVFRTSGTTVGARGAHWLRDVSTYDQGAIAFGRWALTHDFVEDAAILVLGPPPAEATDSSLTHMLASFVATLGRAVLSGGSFFLERDVIDLARLDEAIARLLVERRPALVLGTSFAFVHLLDGLDDAGFRLPPGSRVMQTGGFKGKSREVEPVALRRELADAFAIPESAIVSEYGMTELSSQFYEATVHGGAPGVYVEPPWARVVPVDPVTLVPVAEGAEGIARIEDLLNVDSAFAVLAADRVRRNGAGFELLGRAAGAPPRGCSIAVDEILGRG